MKIEKHIEDLKKSDIPEHNKERILSFDKEMSANGLSDITRYVYIVNMKRFSLYAKKPFNEITKEDVFDFINSLKEDKKIKSERTRYLIILLSFILIFIGFLV